MIKKERKFKVKYSYIIFILLILILHSSFFNSIDFYRNFSNLAVTFIMLILIVLTVLKKRINTFIGVTAIFLFWNIFSSFFLAGGVLDLFNNIKIFSIVLLVNLLIKNHVYSLLKALNLLFSMYIYANFITFILLPNGLYLDNPREGQFRAAWVLGIENQFTYVIIPGVTLILLYTFYKNNKLNLNSIIIIIVAGITVLLSLSATAIISYVLLIAGMSLLIWKGIKVFLNFNLFAISYAIIWFVVVRINSYDFFRNIIENVLNKDMTFSSRTLIWDEAFQLIPLSLWYGYGNNSVVAFTTKEFRAHNLILQIILDNGLISLFVFIILLGLIGYQLVKFGTNIPITILVIGFFALLIGGLTESYRLNHLFLMMILLYNCKHFIVNNNIIANYKL